MSKLPENLDQESTRMQQWLLTVSFWLLEPLHTHNASFCEDFQLQFCAVYYSVAEYACTVYVCARQCVYVCIILGKCVTSWQQASCATHRLKQNCWFRSSAKSHDRAHSCGLKHIRKNTHTHTQPLACVLIEHISPMSQVQSTVLRCRLTKGKPEVFNEQQSTAE